MGVEQPPQRFTQRLHQRSVMLRVELAVELPSVGDPQQAAEVVRVAHGICPYSNATRGNVDVALSVNGVALAGTT